MSLEHWMMFSTFAEQNYFTYPNRDTYKGVIINANMAAYAPAGLASFIMGKLADSCEYLVDPLTHAFQHNPVHISKKDGNLKAAIRALADEYGSPIEGIAGNRPLRPSDLGDEILSEFSGRVLEFQRRKLSSYIEESDDAKYFDADISKTPMALIAPYFYVTETECEDWLTINKKCLEASSAFLLEGEKLFAEIVIDRGILVNDELINVVINQYREIGNLVSGCLIWIDNLNEQEASISELRAQKNMLEKLTEFIPEIINLHGGYYSILLGGELGGKCLTGVAHGPEFGEFRPVVPVGGGIPIAKYYVPLLHSRIRYRDAARLFHSAEWLESPEVFHKEVCDCEICVSEIGGNAGNFTKFGDGVVKTVRRGKGVVSLQFPFNETKIRCLKHYLQRKEKEYRMIRNASKETILQELMDSVDKFTGYIGSSGVAHLSRWISVLSETD